MKISDDITWKLLQNKVVAVNVKSGVYYTMNPVASEIWKAIAQGKQKLEIIELLKEDYPDVNAETIQNDFNEQMTFWVNENIVEV